MLTTVNSNQLASTSLLLCLLCFHSSVSDVDINVCYDNFGCFDSVSVLGMNYLPEPPDKLSASFRVFSRPDPVRYKTIHYQNLTSLKLIPKETKLVLIVHGWIVDSENLMYIQLRQALFVKYQTVIAVDWRKGAGPSSYPQSVANTAMVGRETAYLIKKLCDSRSIKPSMVYLIGFSLGAHVSGNAGRWFASKYKEKIGRITGKFDLGNGVRDTYLLLPTRLISRWISSLKYSSRWRWTLGRGNWVSVNHGRCYSRWRYSYQRRRGFGRFFRLFWTPWAICRHRFLPQWRSRSAAMQQKLGRFNL